MFSSFRTSSEKDGSFELHHRDDFTSPLLDSSLQDIEKEGRNITPRWRKPPSHSRVLLSRRSAGLSLFVLLLVSSILATSRMAQNSDFTTSKGVCFVKKKLGYKCAGSMPYRGASRYVPLWQSEPFPNAFVRRDVAIPAAHMEAHNVTGVQSVMRKALIDKHPEDEDSVLLRVIGTVYDLPLAKSVHISMSNFFWDRFDEYEMRASIQPNSSDPSQVVLGQREFKTAAESMYRFPAHYFKSSSEWLPDGGVMTDERIIPVKLDLLFLGEVVASFDFRLRQQWLPYSRLAICMKPLYGKGVPPMFVEWREHHRQLGWDLVHWSSRHAETKEAVDKLNELTGGYDTFEHMPHIKEGLEEGYWGEIWDEDLAFNDCYATYRQTSEFMGVWDIDEYLAPTTSNPWTADFVENYLTSNWSTWDTESGYLALPMTWVDKRRFGDINEELLLSQDPTLPVQDILDIQHLAQTANGATERHFQEYFKSIYRTGLARGAGIHGGWPGDWARQYPNNMGLVIYHARNEQAWDVKEYIDYPTTPSVVHHWRSLVERIRDMNLNAVYSGPARD